MKKNIGDEDTDQGSNKKWKEDRTSDKGRERKKSST